jgi:hypothetical protein
MKAIPTRRDRGSIAGSGEESVPPKDGKKWADVAE